MPKGQIPVNKGHGAAYYFILNHVGYRGDKCLRWPLGRDKHGRGFLTVNGEHWWAHRLMCKLAHGEPPTSDHTAAHNCGKGHEGCINPRHLEWKTQGDNLEDCRRHGTVVRHHGGNVRRLTPEQINSIKNARGGQTQAYLAAEFGVSEGTISDIWHGRSHTRVSKVPHWTDEQIQQLKDSVALGLSVSQIVASIEGKSEKGVASKAYRLGLKPHR
jgi:GcrA cell cycle regulator